MLYFFLLYVKKKYILDRYEKEKKVIAYYVNNNERIMGQSNKALHEKYEFRDIRRDEIEQAVRIEAICFPPNEAAHGTTNRKCTGSFSGGSGPKNQKDGSFSEWSGNESGTPDG